MAQRCSFCGKTEKQHGGRACFTIGLTQVTGQAMNSVTKDEKMYASYAEARRKRMLQSEAERIENAPSDEPLDPDDAADMDYYGDHNYDEMEDEDGDPPRQSH